MTIVLRKLDDLLHQKLQSINKVNDEIIDCCVVKMNDVEQRAVKRSNELNHKLHELEQRIMLNLSGANCQSMNESREFNDVVNL